MEKDAHGEASKWSLPGLNVSDDYPQKRNCECLGGLFSMEVTCMGKDGEGKKKKSCLIFLADLVRKRE